MEGSVSTLMSDDGFSLGLWLLWKVFAAAALANFAKWPVVFHFECYCWVFILLGHYIDVGPYLTYH